MDSELTFERTERQAGRGQVSRCRERAGYGAAGWWRAIEDVEGTSGVERSERWEMRLIRDKYRHDDHSSMSQ